VHAHDRRIPESSEETRHEVESVGSRGSKVESEGSRGSRKSDIGTSTDLSAPGIPPVYISDLLEQILNSFKNNSHEILKM